jgi:hypothetical protein
MQVQHRHAPLYPSFNALIFPLCRPPPPDLEAANRRRAAAANVKLRGRVLRYNQPHTSWP